MPSIICFEIIPSGTFALPTDNPNFGSFPANESQCHIFQERDAYLYIPCQKEGTPLNVFKLVERFAAAFQHINYNNEEISNQQTKYQTFIHIVAIKDEQWNRFFSGKEKAEDVQSNESRFKNAVLYLKSIKGGKEIVANIASLAEHRLTINEDNILISFNLTSGIENKAFYLNLALMLALKQSGKLSENKLGELLKTIQTALSLTNFRKYSLPTHLVNKHGQITKTFQHDSSTLLEKIKNSLQSIENPSSSPDTDDTIPVTPSPEDESTSISAACPSYHSLESSLENSDEPVVPDTPLREPELSLSNSTEEEEEESSERAAKRQKTSLTSNAATFLHSPSSPFKSPRDPGKDTGAPSSPDTRLLFKH